MARAPTDSTGPRSSNRAPPRRSKRLRAGRERRMTTDADQAQRLGQDDIDASKAPLMDHLIELRQRLVHALVAIFIGFVVCFAFAEQIYNLLVIPYRWAAGAESKIDMIYTAPHEFFFTQVKLALFG